MPGFAAFASYAPKREVPNADLPVFFHNIEERTGIRSRRIATSETVVSMAAEVVNRLCKELHLRVSECAGIVLASCSPDVEDQSRELATSLGFPSDRPVMGINDACTSFVSAVREGVSLSKQHGGGILVIASEKLSEMTNFADGKTGMLFGDFAAGAVIAKNGRHRILDVFSRTVETPKEIVGLRETHDAVDPDGKKSTRPCIQMPGGTELFKTVPDKMVALIEEGIARYNSRVGPSHRQWALSKEHIARVLPHQPNGRILQRIPKVFERLLWPRPFPPVANEIADMGNIGSASIPTLLSRYRFSRWDDMVIACPAVGGGPNLEWGKLTEGNILISLDTDEARVGAM